MKAARQIGLFLSCLFAAASHAEPTVPFHLVFVVVVLVGALGCDVGAPLIGQSVVRECSLRVVCKYVWLGHGVRCREDDCTLQEEFVEKIGQVAGRGSFFLSSAIGYSGGFGTRVPPVADGCVAKLKLNIF